MEQVVHIVGRGIAGLALAFEFATRGRPVHIHGPRFVTGSATPAAVGVCSVKGNIEAQTPLFEAKITAQSRIFRWLEKIEQTSCLKISRRRGVIEPIFNLKGYETIRERVFHRKFTGCNRSKFIDISLLPSYLQGGLGGVSYTEDCWFNPIEALDSLEKALLYLGVTFSSALVERIEDHPDHGLVLLTQSGPIPVVDLVVAAGVFTNEILQRSGIEGFRQTPVEGESLFGQRYGNDPDSTLNFMKMNFVAYGSHIAFGSTSRPRKSITECHPDPSGSLFLHREIAGCLPYVFSSSRWGIRGRFRSQAPVCEFVFTPTGNRRFLFVSGFHKSGLQLAHYVAGQAVDKLLNSAY